MMENNKNGKRKWKEVEAKKEFDKIGYLAFQASILLQSVEREVAYRHK